MPYDDPDPTDPQMLVGVMLPSGPEAMREMAYVFAEEFARMGYGRDEILRLFRNPFYAGAHGAYRALGSDAITVIIDECVAVWGRVRAVDREAEPGGRRPRGTSTVREPMPCSGGPCGRPPPPRARGAGTRPAATPAVARPNGPVRQGWSGEE